MTGIIILVAVAAVFRTVGSVLRHKHVPAPLRVLGCAISVGSGWVLACGAGAWSGVWIAIVLGAICGLCELRFEGPVWRAGVDVASVLLAGLASGGASYAPILIAAAGLALGAFGVDRLVNLLSAPAARRFSLVCFAIASAVMLVGWTRVAPEFGVFEEAFHERPLGWLDLSLMRKTIGERVDLETGAVAWLERPSRPDASVGAVLFHGNAWEGSRQKSACILRRCLLNAGYVVLSVDHPGYGASPVPPLGGPLETWDPSSTDLAAIRAIRRVAGIQQVVAVGHSMGCGDVLRVLLHEGRVDAAVLFGAGLSPPPSSDAYWIKRFHRERQLADSSLPDDRVLQIIHQWYRSEDLLRALASASTPGTPLTFAQFGFEHGDNARTRGAYFAMLPGPKEIWGLDNSTHYFNTLNLGEIVVGDTRVAAAIRDRFVRLRFELSRDTHPGGEGPHAGRPFPTVSLACESVGCKQHQCRGNNAVVARASDADRSLTLGDRPEEECPVERRIGE